MKKGLFLFLLLGAAAIGVIQWLKSDAPITTYADNKHQKEGGKHEEEEGKLPLHRRIAGTLNYLNAMRVNPLTGELDYKAINKAREDAAQLIAEKDGENTMAWEHLGPNNVGGRTRALWIDPNNSNHLIAGGVSGGLFVSNDGASNWTRHPQNFELQNLSVNSVTQGSDGAIYVGTGEIFAGYGYVGAGFPGYGVLKSTDNGATFQQVPSTIPGAANDPSQVWASVSEMAADQQENIVYAGTADGIFVSVNGGDFVTPNGAPSNADGLVFDMVMGANGLLHAIIGSDYYHITHTGTGNDLSFTYTKKNGNNAGQLPSISGRRCMAISASDPNYVYVVAVSSAGCLDRVFQSTDGGNNWAVIGTGAPGFFDPAANGFGNNIYCQGFYDLAIAVSPANPNMIFVAGITLWRWINTEGWQAVSDWTAAESDPSYVHADIHNMYFDPNNPGRMYVVSDGGVSKTEDAGAASVAFMVRNRNYNVTQFYTVSGSWEGAVMGGSQDNGVQFVSFDGQNAALSANEIQGGDGGDVEFSQTNLNVLFLGSPSTTGYIGRSSNGGAGFGCFFDEKINADASDGCVMDGGGNWVTPFYFWEDMPLYQSTGQRKSQFITGTANGKVWLTPEALNLSSTPEWFLAGTIGGTGNKTITAVSISKDGNYAAAATAAGRLMRIAIAENDTDYTVLQIASNVIGGGGAYITSVNFGNTSNDLVITYGGYGGNDKVFYCDNFSTATSVGDLNFVSIHKNLPKFPVFSAIIDADDSNRIIAGTDLGVWNYDRTAETWSPQIAGMGRVPVFEVRQEPMRDLNCHVLYVGSYGKGFWRSTTLTAPGCDTQLPVWSDITPTNAQSFSMVLFPMPMTQQATVQVSLPTSADQLSISVFDMQGKQMSQTQYSQQAAGTHQFDMARGSLTAGMYLVVVNADGRKMTRKMIVQ